MSLPANQQEASQWVQRMFGEIAPRYDLLNHLLSFNIDRSWRAALKRCLAEVLEQPGAQVLDLCCGTGDVMVELYSDTSAQVIGADFCHPMLVAARAKLDKRNYPVRLVEADALELPISSATLDAISIAFGFRNLTNYTAGLKELQRVLKPGGVLAILEFSHPPGRFMKLAYGFYSGVVLPALGAALSGSREAYSYLPESVRKFPGPEALSELLEASGFRDTRFTLLSQGIAALHSGVKK
jgi:demethylmenaquinone methyltransferase/2-methoxy-6-polyprenyl-1,4-benzoquinol methylase